MSWRLWISGEGKSISDPESTPDLLRKDIIFIKGRGEGQKKSPKMWVPHTENAEQDSNRPQNDTPDHDFG